MKLISNTYAYLNRFVAREVNYHRIKPTNMLLYLTNRCTSQCRSCAMWERKVTAREMTLAEWKRFIDMMAGRNIINVEMFGGDALMRKDVLFPITEYIKKKGIPQVDLTTNCNLMDEETADAVVDSGIDIVYVSLDGVGELHDNVRGVAGSFERTRKGIENLLKARMNNKKPAITLNCTISSLNIRGFDRVLAFGEEIGVDKVSFEYVGQFPMSSVAGSSIHGITPEPYYVSQDNPIYLSYEQAKYLKFKIRMMRDTARNMSVRFNASNIDCLTVENMARGVFPNRKCYICRYLVIVDPYGNILPCPFFNTYVLGNVRNNHFDDIWQNERHKMFVRYSGENRLDMCRYCILGVERNPTFWQAVKKQYLEYTGKGYDEQ